MDNSHMSTLILINPHAAGGRARHLLPPMNAWLSSQSMAIKPDTVMPDSLKEAQHAIALQPKGTRIVVVGGDGTLNQMLPCLMQGQHVVGLVPYGSGNDSARAWGLHKFAWQEALAFALQGSISDIDVGSIQLNHQDVHYFHSSLAVGFDASVGNRALAGPKYLRGLPRYLLATLRELTHLKNWPIKVHANGLLIHEGQSLLASTLNTPTYGGGMPAVPHANLTDGQLNLLIGGRFNRMQTLLMLPRLLMGQHLDHPRIQSRPITLTTITSSEYIPVAADGEPLGMASHLQIHVIPSALQVIKNS
jgi:diacylglycerol kinase family enzyme